MRIAVDSSGDPWIVDASGNIYWAQSWATGGWNHVLGSASDIGAGGGNVWILGPHGPSDNGLASVWTGGLQTSGGGAPFTAVGGGGQNITVGPSGLPALTNSVNAIYRRI